jgi:hypothetical protein
MKNLSITIYSSQMPAAIGVRGWHNAEENGGWDPADLWGVDTAVAEDMLAVSKLAKDSHRYPGDLGFEPEIQAIWRIRSGERTPQERDQ